MADLTFRGIVARQLRLLQRISEALAARVLAGGRVELDNLFACQDRLEHWLQYFSPLGLEASGDGFDAPPPLPEMRPAAPLPHEVPAYVQAMEEAYPAETQRPRVHFPPEPLWVDDLEREREREGEG